MPRVCVFGDSISRGYHDKEIGGWVNRLRIYFDNSEQYKDISVYDLSISGDSTVETLKRFDAECSVRNPDVIIFAIGINDSRMSDTTNDHWDPVDKFKNNLKELATRAKKHSDKVVFVGPNKVEESKTTPIPWDTTENYLNEYVEEYDSLIQQIADDAEVMYIRMYDLLKDSDLYDGLHPNAEGHRKMFEKVKSELEQSGYIS